MCKTTIKKSKCSSRRRSSNSGDNHTAIKQSRQHSTPATKTEQQPQPQLKKSVRFHSRLRFRHAASNPKSMAEVQAIWYSSDELAEFMHREHNLRIHLAVGHDRQCRDSKTLSLLGLFSKQEQETVYQRRQACKRVIFEQQEIEFLGQDSSMAEAYSKLTIKAAKSAYRRAVRFSKHVEELWEEPDMEDVELDSASLPEVEQRKEDDATTRLGDFVRTSMYACPKSSWSHLVTTDDHSSDSSIECAEDETETASSSWIGGLIRRRKYVQQKEEQAPRTVIHRSIKVAKKAANLRYRRRVERSTQQNRFVRGIGSLLLGAEDDRVPLMMMQ